MTVSTIGTLSVGAVNIGVALAIPVLGSSLSEILALTASLEAQIAANLTLSLTLPDPLAIAAAIAEAAATAVAKIEEILLNIPGPLVDANLDLSAQLSLLLALSLNLKGLLATLSAAMSAGGIHAFRVDSTPASLGGEISALVSGGMPGGGLPTARVRGVLLLTEDPAAFTALSTLLLT